MAQTKSSPGAGTPGPGKKEAGKAKTTKTQKDSNMTSKNKATKSRAAEFILPQGYTSPLEEFAEIPITATQKIKSSVYFRVKGGKGFEPLPLMLVVDDRGIEKIGYLVHPAIVSDLVDIADQLKMYSARLIITRDSEKKILFTPALTTENKTNFMLVARVKILKEAEDRWVRMMWDKDVNVHRAVYPKFPISDPEWGKLEPFDEMILNAFDGRIIESLEHDFVKYLMGAE